VRKKQDFPLGVRCSSPRVHTTRVHTTRYWRVNRPLIGHDAGWSDTVSIKPWRLLAQRLQRVVNREGRWSRSKLKWEPLLDPIFFRSQADTDSEVACAEN
jgi:hypothetical protein